MTDSPADRLAAIDADLARIATEQAALLAAGEPDRLAHQRARDESMRAQARVNDATNAVMGLERESTLRAVLTFDLGGLRARRAAASRELDAATAALAAASEAQVAAWEATEESRLAIGALRRQHEALTAQRGQLVEESLLATGGGPAEQFTALAAQEESLQATYRDLDRISSGLDRLRGEVRRAHQEATRYRSSSSFGSGINYGGLNVGGISVGGVDLGGVSIGGLNVGGISMGGFDPLASSSSSWSHKSRVTGSAPDAGTVVDCAKTTKALADLERELDRVRGWSEPTASQLSGLERAVDAAVSAVDRDKRDVAAARTQASSSRQALLDVFVAQLTSGRQVRVQGPGTGRAHDLGHQA